MYATKTMNKNVIKESYISIGDPYKQGGGKMSSRFKNKQMQTNPPKIPAANIGYFDKIKYAPDNFVDRTMYLKEQPVEKRKLAFGSHDASRRGEFMGAVRTEQWRETLKREAQFNCRDYSDEATKTAQKAVEDNQLIEVARTITNPDAPHLNISQHLYDVGGKQATAACQKCPRETFYCKHVTDGMRRTGGAQLSSQQVGDGVLGVNVRPQFARVRNTKHFLDNSHLGASS